MFIRLIKVTLLLAIVTVAFLTCVLHYKSNIFRQIEGVFLSLQWTLLVCLAVWGGTFVFLTFRRKDLPLIGLLFISIGAHFIGTAGYPAVDALTLLAGVTLGRGARFTLDGRWKMEDVAKEEIRNNKPVRTFLVGLIELMALPAWCHLDMVGAYQGARWMGLWDNPNIYGMMMGSGSILAIGLFVANTKAESGKLLSRFLRFIASKMNWFLAIAAVMMLVGLLMSYSRGAWTATAIALLYLAWCYGKLKWRFVLPVVLVAATVVAVFWHSTADTAPWYLKRLDFSRPSAQHRVSAWRGAVRMMRDHPLGVGWNQAVSVYDKNYSPPEGGAAALTTNSYFMLGTELGLPGLLCFVAYVGLRLRGKCRIENEEGRIQTACRAGALVFVVAFWFDGGLFDLPTAAVFWVLLELGTFDSLAKQKPLTQP